MSELALNLDHPPVWLAGSARGVPAQADLRWSRGSDSPNARVLMPLLEAFSDIGGVVTGDAMAALLRDRTDQPISMLARWIVQREVISFPWQSNTMLPLFQFDLVLLHLRPGVPKVLAELREAFDDLELADWFARPNSWLQGRAPAQRFEQDLSAVIQAARADRFVALGD